VLPHKSRHYLLQGLTGTPDVVDQLLRGASRDMLDRRPDPARFTLREVVCHLADWEGVWLERLSAMRTRDNPALQGYDEGQWALDHDYAHADMAEQQARFRAGRAELMALLESLAPEEWERAGCHSEIGPVTIESLAVLVLGHDGYHTRQIAQWIAGGQRSAPRTGIGAQRGAWPVESPGFS